MLANRLGVRAIKALQIFREIKKTASKHIANHSRPLQGLEVSERLKLQDVYFIEETALSYAIWRSIILRSLQDVWFAKKAIKLAESIARERKLKNNQVIIHQTEPKLPGDFRASFLHDTLMYSDQLTAISITPIFFVAMSLFQLGLRRRFHMPVQKVNRYFFSR